MNGQDSGKDHIHYIRSLANEIWCKENDTLHGKRMDWDDCIRAALKLHVSGLLRIKNDEASKNPRRTWW